jgi:predicted RNase H-like HicB family nuclease
VKLSWDMDDQTYYVYIPELGVMTYLDTLPGALYMAGDAGKLMLEQQMACNSAHPHPPTGNPSAAA